MDVIKISLTELGKLARFNGYSVAGHNASDFAKELSVHVGVDVHYTDRVLKFRNGEHTDTEEL